MPPLALVFAGVLSFFGLVFEARRYRCFNVWRARARWMERHCYVLRRPHEALPIF